MEAVWQQASQCATVRVCIVMVVCATSALCALMHAHESVHVYIYIHTYIIHIYIYIRCHESDARPSVVCRNSPIHVSLSAPVPGLLQSVQLYFYDPSQGFYSVDY